MSTSVRRRPLVSSEINVLERCAQQPRGRLDFEGIERMALQVLIREGWLTQVEAAPVPLYRTSPAGTVLLHLAQIETE